MILSVCAATLPYAQPPDTYDTSARRGPGGCGWPMAITHAHEDPALRPARPCAAPHRVPCGAPGRGESRPNHPGTYGTGPTCTPREGGSTVRPVAPTLPRRSQGASTSKNLARLLAYFSAPLTKTCGISGLLLVVGSSALLRAHQGGGRLRRRSPSAPSVHTWPLSASRPRARPPSPHGTQRRTSGPRCV